MLKNVMMLSTAGMLAATSALAAVEATATTDLNLRAGPNSAAEILNVIPADGAVTVMECVEAAQWCRVSFDGTEGWAYSPYLSATVEGETVMVPDNISRLEIGTVTVQESQKDDAALAGATMAGAIALGAAAGPAGIAASALAGAITGAAAAPGEEVVTYVRENPVEPVYLDGEVVVGAALPDTVTLVEVPDSPFRYVYVNGLPVVVDTETRQIVRVLR
jgi:uncharacterized protein YraI